VQLVGDAAALDRRHERSDLVRLVSDDLAADDLHAEPVP